MKIALSLLTLSGLSFAFIAAFSTSQGKSEFFIEELGSYEISKGYGVDLFLDENEKINIRHRTPKVTTKGGEGYIEPDGDWKLYVEDGTKLWFIRPDSVTLKYEFEKSGGNYGLFNCHDSSKVNKQIKEMLPEAVLQSMTPELVTRMNNAVVVDVGQI